MLSLSAAMFSAAEGSPLVAITIPVAVFACLTVDRPRRSGLGQGISFVLGLAALWAAGLEFMKGDVEARLLAPSHLLAYFVWIILLQRKEHRHYWMLLGLSVLQVALASLLTSGAWLGLALVTYAVLALWTMGVFTLHRAVERIGGPERIESTTAARSASAGHGWRNWRSTRSSVRNAVHLDPEESIIGWHFAGGAATAAILSLAMTAAFFVLIPRVWSNQIQLFDNSPLAGTRTLTGFTPEITLGDMGEILENDDLVMEIELFDLKTGEPVPAAEYEERLGGADPLFRGQVLEIYEHARWTRSPREIWNRAAQKPGASEALVERIRLQPIGTPMLFAAGRILTCVSWRANEPLLQDRTAGTFRRNDDVDLTREFRYDAFASTARSSRSFAPEAYITDCMGLPPGMRRVAELSHAVVMADGPAHSEVEAVERLEAYLRDSPEFSYSLDLSIEDPRIDPVADFLFNRRRGHCEYYASALTLMLRCVGVPARMVSGFKGGQLNPGTGLFEVRQLHAHAWTEAYVDNQWIALDPTPPARDHSVAALQEKSSGSWSRLRDRWTQVWNQGVRLSKGDQDELVYQPIREGFAGTLQAMREMRGTPASLLQGLRSLLSSPDRWFSWRGGVAAFVLLIVLAALWKVLRWVTTWVGRFRGDVSVMRRSAPLVPFYERFRQLASRAGMERRGAETQREFAASVQRRMQGSTAAAPLAALPEDVVRGYYRVRFGNESLSEAETRELLSRLDRFEAGLPELRRTVSSGPARESRSNGNAAAGVRQGR